MQIRTTLRLYLTQVSIAKINTTNNKCRRECGKEGNPHLLLVGLQTGSHSGSQFGESSKTKIKYTIWPKLYVVMPKGLDMLHQILAQPYSLTWCSQWLTTETADEHINYLQWHYGMLSSVKRSGIWSQEIWWEMQRIRPRPRKKSVSLLWFLAPNL